MPKETVVHVGPLPNLSVFSDIFGTITVTNNVLEVWSFRNAVLLKHPNNLATMLSNNNSVLFFIISVMYQHTEGQLQMIIIKIRNIMSLLCYK